MLARVLTQTLSSGLRIRLVDRESALARPHQEAVSRDRMQSSEGGGFPIPSLRDSRQGRPFDTVCRTMSASRSKERVLTRHLVPQDLPQDLSFPSSTGRSAKSAAARCSVSRLRQESGAQLDVVPPRRRSQSDSRRRAFSPPPAQHRDPRYQRV